MKHQVKKIWSLLILINYKNLLIICGVSNLTIKLLAQKRLVFKQRKIKLESSRKNRDYNK